MTYIPTSTRIAQLGLREKQKQEVRPVASSHPRAEGVWKAIPCSTLAPSKYQRRR